MKHLSLHGIKLNTTDSSNLNKFNKNINKNPW